MTIMLALIPPEIVTYYIVPLLSPEDVVHLFDCIEGEVSEELYNRVFHDNVRFGSYNLEMFRQRAHCRLYIFEDAAKGLLRISGIPRAKRVARYYGALLNRPYPAFKVKGTGDILQVHASNLSYQFVNLQGELYLSGIHGSSHYGLDKMHRLNVSLSPLVQVGFSERSFLALDESGLVWDWCSSRAPQRGVPVLLTKLRHNHLRRIAGQIVALKASDTWSACQVKGRGIVIWHQEKTYRHQKGLNLPQTHTVPRTAHGIQDFLLEGSILVCLRRDGSLTAVDLWTMQSFPIDSVNQFVQIIPYNDYAFLAVTKDGRIVVVFSAFRNGKLLHACRVVKGMAKVDVASVAISGRHILALTKQGEVYSCTYKQKIDENALTLEQEGLLKLAVQGKAYGVYAGNDYIAVLATEE